MDTFSRWFHAFAAFVGRTLGRVAALTIGSALMVLGLAMMVTIVMLPMGVVLDLLGLMIVLGAIFAPDGRKTSAR
jgi:hypothetical protein